MIYRRVVKRPIDVAASGVALAIAGIPLLLAMLAIRLTSRGPVFFRQTRAGRDGRPFSILKLRTMTVDPARLSVQTRAGDPGVLPVGHILRRLKIDELPQLINVLKGEMSLVGPRPCLEETRDEMPDWARRRFDVRPGITGRAQVNGNIALSWEERWRHDVLYVDTLTFASDLKIIAKTVLVVLLNEERFRKPT